MKDASTIADEQAAARLLLAHPLVVAHGPLADGLRLVRRHESHLREQFSQILGYQLVVEAGFARLYKAGLGNASRSALRPGKATPLSPQAYARLTLIVAVLLTSREQVLLSALVQELRIAAAETGIEVADTIAERRAIVAALRVLVEWGVLVEDEGNVAGYADSDAYEVLLTIRREVVRHLVIGPLRASGTPAEFISAASAAGGGGPRHSVRRKLVETPVVYRDELTEEDANWLRQYQRREEDVLGDFLGASLEIRAEGVALFHPELSDKDFPGQGTVPQAALLVVAELVRRLRPASVPNAREVLVVGIPIPDGLIEQVVAEQIERHRRRWGRMWVDDPELLTHEICQLLLEMRLLARADANYSETRGSSREAGWVLLAAASRYAAQERIVDDSPTLDFLSAQDHE